MQAQLCLNEIVYVCVLNSGACTSQAVLIVSTAKGNAQGLRYSAFNLHGIGPSKFDRCTLDTYKIPCCQMPGIARVTQGVSSLDVYKVALGTFTFTSLSVSKQIFPLGIWAPNNKSNRQ